MPSATEQSVVIAEDRRAISRLIFRSAVRFRLMRKLIGMEAYEWYQRHQPAFRGPFHSKDLAKNASTKEESPNFVGGKGHGFHCGLIAIRKSLRLTPLHSLTFQSRKPKAINARKTERGAGTR